MFKYFRELSWRTSARDMFEDCIINIEFLGVICSIILSTFLDAEYCALIRMCRLEMSCSNNEFIQVVFAL